MSTELIFEVINNNFSIFSGLIFAYFGYRLLLFSLQSPTIETNLEASFTRHQKDQLIRVAPGAFFSFLGAALIFVQYKLALVVLFYLFAIIAGLAFCIAGYFLFQVGVFESSDVDATFKDFRLLIKRASPGTMFALFGAVIIVTCVWQGTGMLSIAVQK